VNEWETTSVDLKKRLDAGDDVFILDVRERTNIRSTVFRALC